MIVEEYRVEERERPAGDVLVVATGTVVAIMRRAS